MVVIDTSVWVQAFRLEESEEKAEVDALLARGQVLMAGPVLAEVLQGAQGEQEFDRLRYRLTAIPYVAETEETWIHVSALSRQLRQRGTTLALVDLLIAALAMENEASVYTLDEHFQSIPGLKLHEVGER